LKDFLHADRPHIGLITNHGYGGADIPFGGAPDTGGQNVYVNAYARALDQLGYKVTIYARGGFPFHHSDDIREGEEFLTSNVRYVYVPGGGSEFIRKEDISTALIEEVWWIYDHIEFEAGRNGVLPWEYYEMINSHYWDAGVIAVSLIVKWQNDLTARMIQKLTEDVVSPVNFRKFSNERHYHSVSKAPAYSLGKLLLDSIADTNYIYQEEIMKRAFENWCEKSKLARQISENLGGHIEWRDLRSSVAAATKELRPLVLSQVLGAAVFGQQVHPAIFERTEFRKYRNFDEMETFGDIMLNALTRVNKHVWTPHSLGVIKEWNFRKKPDEVKRELKFRERRSHERLICDYTPALGATSYEIAESLVANYGADINDVLFFPPGVDMSIFHEYTDREMKDLYRYLEKKTGLSATDIADKLIIFEASRMDVTKRKDVILRAFRDVVQRGCRDCILIIGGGPDNDVFKSLQQELEASPDLSGRAFLLGFVEDEFMPLLFSRCDIYISASEMEGFGMSVAQAAADGKPIISSDKIPFTSYYLENEAFIVPAGDTDGFTDSMEQLIRDEELRLKMGHRTREKAMGLKWENLTRQFLLNLNTKNFNIPITEKLLN
jgi:glycosyltransferase involved in cell wall biosynthesis